MVLLCHRYLKGSISDHQDEKFWQYFENWLNYWHFLTEKIFSRRKKNPFKLKIAITRPKKNISSSAFWKHPILESTKRFFNKIECYMGSLGSLLIFLGSQIFLGWSPPPKKKIKIDQMLSYTHISKVIKSKNMFI